MTHFLDKKYKSQVSDKDFDILFSGKKKMVENPVFGESSRDYIEMNIFNTNGNFLESIRLGEVKEYIDTKGEFNINPGIILRRNGYFSGDYNIEFNFLREVAGSNQTVLVDSNKNIYNGEYDVLIDGSIVKKGTTKELTELDYKYYIEDISSDKKEVRLATLPIKNDRYKQEFKNLTETQATIYPKDIGQDVLNFDNPSLKPSSTEFVLNNNSNITLDKSLIGSELIINDAYEIMDLTEFGADNDGFSIGCHKVGKTSFGSINLGDKSNGTGASYFYTNLFSDIAANADSTAEREVAAHAAKIKGDSGIPFFGGAYTIGYRTLGRQGGFPIEILTTITDLDKIKALDPELTATLKGRDLVDTSNTFESTSKIKEFIGNGTRTILPVPTNHRNFGGLYDVEFNLTFDVGGETRRGIRIYRPNLFCVLPTRKVVDEERVIFTFVGQGINY